MPEKQDSSPLIAAADVGDISVRAWRFPEGRRIPQERGGIAYADLVVNGGPPPSKRFHLAYFLNPETAEAEARFALDRIISALREAG